MGERRVVNECNVAHLIAAPHRRELLHDGDGSFNVQEAYYPCIMVHIGYVIVPQLANVSQSPTVTSLRDR